jgi:protein-S-isoprenylcysteine O-methyltransferase Ste14
VPWSRNAAPPRSSSRADQVRSRPRSWLHLSRDAPAGRGSADTVRLVVFGRAIPAVFFLWLAYLQTRRLNTDVNLLPKPVTVSALVSGPLPATLYLVFCVIPVFIYLGRPMPQARDGRLVPKALALVGTLMVLIVGALPQGHLLYAPPSWVGGVSSSLTLLAFIVIVSSLLFLRRSLSIFPEARRLVIGGPYQLVRHPLYTAEILATLSFAMASPTLSVVALLVPFIATQLLRARYEEALLMRVFPAYRSYASRTWRLVPFVW